MNAHQALRNALRLSALWVLSRFYRTPFPTVFMYHSVNPSSRLYFTVTPEEFSRQLQYLQTNGYHAISMDQIASFYEHHAPLSAKTVCVTFDDGYLDNLTEALPILEQFQTPAIIYVTTDSALQRKSQQQFAVCSPDEIRTLAAHPLITIGAHTHTHPKLAKLGREQAQEDIGRGRELLEEWIRQPVRHFAYPYGNFSAETVEILQEMGFRTAVTVEPENVGLHRDAFRIGRIPIDEGVPFWLFKTTCTRAIPIYSALKSRGERVIEGIARAMHAHSSAFRRIRR